MPTFGNNTYLIGEYDSASVAAELMRLLHVVVDEQSILIPETADGAVMFARLVRNTKWTSAKRYLT